jgi:hypothetical protein
MYPPFSNAHWCGAETPEGRAYVILPIPQDRLAAFAVLMVAQWIGRGRPPRNNPETS